MGWLDDQPTLLLFDDFLNLSLKSYRISHQRSNGKLHTIVSLLILVLVNRQAGLPDEVQQLLLQ